jgi:D-alanyl-D-alanine carboxypeptidase/D-alanyl-D-alanine-endopeptidase (penicillin-binding protein 4)
MEVAMRALARRRLPLAAAVVVTALVATGCAQPQDQAGFAALAEDVEPEPVPPAQAPEPLLPETGLDAAPGVDPQVLAAALAAPLADPALGPAPGAVVLDAGTGAVLGGVRADAPLAPASSLKVVTAASALTAMGPADRVQTRVVDAGAAGIVLVGGGDPTLLTLAPERPAYPAGATLDDLARRTAAALLAAERPAVAVRYDSGLFAGPAVLPDWEPTFVRDDIVTPVSALTLDPASAQIDEVALEADPALTAATWFAARLAAYGVAASGPVTAGSAGDGAPLLAEVSSPPVAALVDRMLDLSDNDVAEALFRLAAIARDLPGTFEGGSAAAAAALSELAVPAPGLVLRDGSGLSRANRITPTTLARVLAIAVAGPAQGQDPLSSTVDESTWLPGGLSVAGLTGSLAVRFRTPSTAAAAGRVHGKTGTLTGVSSLTGAVATLQGRPVVFSVISSGTTNTISARSALDAIAATIAACGCTAPVPAPAAGP